MKRCAGLQRSSLIAGVVGLSLVGCSDDPAPSGSVSFRAGPSHDTERTPLQKRALQVPANSSAPHRLVVKFADAAQVRTDSASLRSRTGEDISSILGLAAEHGITFEPLLDIEEARVEALLDRARINSGRPQPDLLGLHSVVAEDLSLERLTEVGRALQSQAIVEFAYFEALSPPNPATDIDPVTPDLVEFQGYRGAMGIDMEAAAAMGLDGTGIRISDVEYNWNVNHEEWNDGAITIEAGHTIPADLEFDGAHGTAVAGELVAHGEGYGVTGLTPASPLFVYPQISIEGGNRRVDAVTSALADSAPGDVVLLEIQTTENITGRLGPGELEEAVWMVTRVGVDAGVVVVAAAGNGALDLDGDEVAYYRNRGDSGAVIVGAGDPVSRARLQFSTYGERVDVQGWGEDVFTAGYGQYAEYGDDRNQRYTGSFGGTSSASPIVTGAAVLIQQAAIAKNGPLTSEQMRAVLIASGLPQGSGNPIGPLPQVSAALDGVLEPDLDGPTVSFITPSDNVGVEESVFETDLEIDAQDASNVVTQVQIAIAGEMLPVIDADPPFVFEGVIFPEGTWEVVAFATDVWGNTGESAPLTIAVGIELPPESTGQAEESSAGDSSSSSSGDDTSGGTAGPTTAPPPDPLPTEDDSSAEDGTETDGPSAQGDDSGCGCTTRPTPASPAWLLLGLLGLLGRGRRRPSVEL